MADIRIALSKGRILEETAPLLARVGAVPKEDPERSRKLILATRMSGVRLIVVRASDVPTYVQHGAAELGIAACRMVVATRRGFDYPAAVRQGARLRIATKYVQTTHEHFAAKGVHVDLIRLYGSMELAPLVGLADAIVDLVSTGGTLKANKLLAIEHIMDISSRLVVNQASLKVKRETLQPIIDAFAQAVEK